MAYDDNQPIFQGIIYDLNGNAVGVRLDGAVYRIETFSRLTDGTLDAELVTDENGVNRLRVETQGEGRFEGLVVVDYYVAAAASAVNDYMLIDLDNSGGSPGTPGAGPYKHDETGTGIKLRGMSAKLVKGKVKDTWNMYFGVITAVDGTDADISWFEIGAVHASDTARTAERIDPTMFPLELDMTSTLAKVAAGFQSVADTTIHTGMTLDDIAGNTITPAVGDIVLRVNREGGDGTALIHYTLWYIAE